MKRWRVLTIAVLFVALVSALLVSCSSDEGKNNGQAEDKEYTVSVTQSDDYQITPESTKAKEGEEVRLTVTVLNEDVYIKAVKFNEFDCTKTDTGYKFVMPASDVTLVVETGEYAEVRENGIASFSENNVTTIPVNGTGTQAQVGFDKRVWCFDIDFNANYMADLGSEIKSSDQSVIPDSAITVKSYTKADLNIGGINDFEIVKCKVLFDTSKISEGTTWITMDFVNNNSSSQKGSLLVKVTVCGYGKLEIEAMNETLTFDVSEVGDPDATYTVRIYDEDFMGGTTQGEYAGFNRTLTATDGKIVLSFDYAVGHVYQVRITAGANDDYMTSLRISGIVVAGGGYTGDADYAGEGDLTFSTPDCNLELKVYTE